MKIQTAPTQSFSEHASSLNYKILWIQMNLSTLSTAIYQPPNGPYQENKLKVLSYKSRILNPQEQKFQRLIENFFV